MARCDGEFAAERQQAMRGGSTKTIGVQCHRCRRLPHALRCDCERRRATQSGSAQNHREKRTGQTVGYLQLAQTRFRLYAVAVLLFVTDHAVTFTNNLGQRAVRMPKVKQKISGCFLTFTGAENFCVIRSCLDTLRKQGHGMLEVPLRAFKGKNIIKNSPRKKPMKS